MNDKPEFVANGFANYYAKLYQPYEESSRYDIPDDETLSV